MDNIQQPILSRYDIVFFLLEAGEERKMIVNGPSSVEPQSHCGQRCK